MQDNANWHEKYYSDEALEELRKREWNPELQEKLSKQWTELFHDVEAAFDEDPAGENAQALVGRWQALIQEFTGGNPEVAKGLKAVWQDKANIPASSQAHMKSYGNPEVYDYIQKAMAAGK